MHRNQVTEAKMTVHVGFVNLSKANTTDGDISSWVREAAMTVHIRFLNLYTACASVSCKRDF